MTYVDPKDVVSPKSHWRLLEVLYDGGPGEWSVAEGQWDHGGKWSVVLAIRWNGHDTAAIGNPQSRGLPTWFILPAALEEPVRTALRELTDQTRD